MASKFKPGDQVRTKSGWSGMSHGKGTVVSVTSDDAPDGCGVVLHKHATDGPIHFYDSELTKIDETR